MRGYCESRFGGTWKRQTDRAGVKTSPFTKPTKPARVLSEKNRARSRGFALTFAEQRPAVRLCTEKRPMAGHSFCCLRELRKAKGIFAQNFFHVASTRFRRI